MSKERRGFSGQNRNIEELAFYYHQNVIAITYYKNQILRQTIIPTEFIGMTSEEVKLHFSNIEKENELAFCFNLIAATEASLRIDYKIRVSERLKDDLSRDFREIYKEYGDRVSLEDTILEKWKERYPQYKTNIGQYKSILKFRHWFAHGRYWIPKIGGKYDSISIYTICDNIVNKLPLII